MKLKLILGFASLMGVAGMAHADSDRGPPDRRFPGQDRRTQVSCDSNDKKYNTCSVGGSIRDARLAHQNSNADCDRGRSWGIGRDYIWVDRGCRGVFDVTLDGGFGRR